MAYVFSLYHELARKTLHILTVVIPLAYASGLPRSILVIVLAVLSVIAVAIELARVRHARTRAAFQRAVGHLLRPHEREQWAGATWLLLSFLAVVLVAPRPVAVTAMWAVAVGDAAAALVGRSVAERRVDRTRKTIAGSAACFLVTLAGGMLIAALSPVEAVTAAMAATIAEWPQGGVDDNIRIVVAVTAALLVWRQAFS